MKIDTYKFMGADVNPTAKKIENGKPTDALYSKDTIYNVLKTAIEDGRIVDSLKISNLSEEYIKYIFNTKSQNIEVLIPNPNFIDENSLVETIDGKIKIDKPLSNADYINKFDNLVKIKANLIYKNMLLSLAKVAVVGGIVGGIAGGIVYSDIKEHELTEQKNKQYIEQLNEERRKNGAEPISYSTYLENAVDETIENSSLGGRKL